MKVFIITALVILSLSSCPESKHKNDERGNELSNSSVYENGKHTSINETSKLTSFESTVGIKKQQAVVLKNSDTVKLEQYGAIQDGITDNSYALQQAINSGKVIKIDKPTVIRKNIYIYGNARLLGVDNGQIILDGDFANADGRKYVFNCGIITKRGKNKTWTGWIKNLKFTGTPKAAFNYCIQLHNVDGVEIQSNIFDFRRIMQNPTRGDARGCAVEGLNDRGWNAGSMYRKNIKITYNKVLNKQDDVGHEALGVSNAENVVFDHNYCYGMGDDGIALHSVKNFTVSNNKLYLVDGRILITNSQHGRVYNNYVEKIPMQNEHKGEWANSESFLRIGWESPQKYAQNNNDIKIYNNTFSLTAEYSPVKMGKTTVIRVMGAQNCTIENNSIEINCDKQYILSPIIVQRAVKKTHGMPNSILTPKNITISNNSMPSTLDNRVSIHKSINTTSQNITINDSLDR